MVHTMHDTPADDDDDPSSFVLSLLSNAEERLGSICCSFMEQAKALFRDTGSYYS